MKKNKMMRIASVLLIAVLMTTCAISGTFAKYVTSAEGGDSARVAYWGVTVTAYGEEAFVGKYNDAANANGTKVVSDEDVLAPGTNGTLGTVAVTGEPEVMVDITATAELTLEGWMIDASDTSAGTFYCPIIFTVTVGNETTTIDGSTYRSAATLEAAVEENVTDLSATNVAANTDLARDVSITWEWKFGTDSAKATNQTDANDTKLGDLQTAPTIEFTYEVIVTQVD